MSSIPKARRSNVLDVTVTPAGWDAHPEVSRSTIASCVFKDLNSATKISRSELTQSTIQASSTKKGAKIERSQVHNSQVVSAHIHLTKLNHSVVTDCMVERSQLENCSVAAPNRVERTVARSTQFVSSKRVERSRLDDSVVMGDSILERCAIRSSVVADKTCCERSELDSTTITRSRVERSKITDCDVMDCKIEKTDFNGMILKYGIWKNGDLIGRTSKEHEVVIKPRNRPPPVAGTSSFAPPPAVQPLGPGWKAAEAERERFMAEDDAEEESDDEEDFSDSEVTTDEDVVDTITSHSKGSPAYHANRSSHTSRPAALADHNDPPPPYEK